MKSADMVEFDQLNIRKPRDAANIRGDVSKGTALPLSKYIIPSSCPSDKSLISQPDLCLRCDMPLTCFGTCRLYSGFAFDLAYCPYCKGYDFSAPERPDGPYNHQAFTLAQIFAETGRA